MVNNASLIQADSKNFQIKHEPDTVINGQPTLTEINGAALCFFEEDEKESSTFIEESNLLRCREELYAGHVVKEELVLGPVVLQQPDEAATSGIYKGSLCPTVLQADLKDVKNDKTLQSDKKTENDNTREWEYDKTHMVAIIRRENNRSVEEEVNGNESKNIKLNICHLNSVQDSHITDSLDLPESNIINSELNKDPQYSHNESKYLTVTTGKVLDEDLRPKDTSKQTGEKPYTCTYCEYSCIHKSRMKSHLRKHTGEKPYTCTYCTYSFSEKGKLNVHLRIHTGEKPYTCTYCKYSCCDKGSLIVHLRKHTGEKPYSCTYCTCSFSEKSGLNVHMRTHTGEKPYTCTYCTYSCRHSSSLQNHLRKHTGEKPFTCTYCTYSCRYSSSLKNHLRIHTGEKPFTCTYCTYSCKQKTNLKIHLRNHTGEKPYTCTYCTYSCRYSSTLRNHLRKHTGEKPYTCKYCTYSCSYISSLKNHLKKHTSEKP